ncbi:MAG: SDR family NAD(P)-dependent oxidoreductase [Acidimicrobiia bacterium]|nr:SDR family NAD(P)-dependent oxidoreductase [Acidimicrobiia bacterium]MBT8198783.1 SDR family NAD(P)-dependent oxidoreductase [Acidimicrobiia bacterium]NNF68533.1 SDR family NAD(P)-dependent oxidoreductase [Acidimicrobiia bacterium]NNL97165.1 SDR family NAD(P)-dependent oxidoreductase [Acidimicrobiia bacterium]
MTGANSGVGLETTRQLVKQGGHVVMACRRPDAGEEAAKSFAGLDGSYEVMRLDLADLQSVRDFAAEFLRNYDRLDGLVCNAGLANLTNELERTKDGFELTFGVSYFGHFLLTELLLDLLKASAPSRIVLLSSVAHAGSPRNRPRVHLDDLKYETREVKNLAIYNEAKVANILYAMELADRLEGTGVTAYSVHPGWARSNFDKGGSLGVRVMLTLMKLTVYPFVTDSNEESAQTTLHCLLSDDAPSHSGEYFSQHSVLYRDKECRRGGWPMESPNPNARDMETARKLVEASYGLVGLERE